MKRFIPMPVLVACLAVLAAFLDSCTNHPEVENFKQVQLQWKAADDAAELAEFKDACVIDITSKIMNHSIVHASKLVEIFYDVNYSLDKNGALSFEARCSDARFADLPECSWQATCGVGPASVVKFHNER